MKHPIVSASGCFIGLLASNVAFGQTVEERAVIRSRMNLDALTELSVRFSEKYRANKAEAVEMAQENDWPIHEDLPGGGSRELIGVREDGSPI